jgi:hypothetical protein
MELIGRTNLDAARQTFSDFCLKWHKTKQKILTNIKNDEMAMHLIYWHHTTKKKGK